MPGGRRFLKEPISGHKKSRRIPNGTQTARMLCVYYSTREIEMAKFETITPEIAKAILDNNRTNRNISQKIVKRYAQEMKSGNWQKNYEPIVLSKSGRLLNGQHRLMAVIASGMSIEMFVIRDADESITIFDRGRNRSEYNELQLEGVDIADKNTIAIAKLFFYMLGKNNGVGASADYVMFLTYFRKHILNLKTLTLGGKRSGQINSDSAFYQLAYLLALDNGVDIETVQRFVNVFRYGYSPNGELDSAAITLRNMVIQGDIKSENGGGSYRHKGAAITMVALEDYAKGVARKRRYNMERWNRTPYIEYDKYKEMVKTWSDTTIESAIRQYKEACKNE
jgi:hypothetical protein